jgi:hypothetical protein
MRMVVIKAIARMILLRAERRRSMNLPGFEAEAKAMTEEGRGEELE